MNRIFTSLILIILAIALFVVYTNPAYQGAQLKQAELAGYETTLSQSKELIGLRDDLLAKRNALPSDGLSRMQLLLPDNVDNIRLIIDINDIAARYHLQVQDISVGAAGSAGGSSATGAINTAANASAVGSVTLSFSVVASYENFVAFLKDLERSLRLVDVSTISFSAAGKNSDAYSTTITTYWLK